MSRFVMGSKTMLEEHTLQPKQAYLYKIIKEM